MPREYRDCMFRSEWIKDAKSKRWVASDRRDWCLKSQKRKSSAIMSRSVTDSCQTHEYLRLTNFQSQTLFL